MLRSFLATVDHGSLSAAATAIGTTQPTLSRHVRELESVVGTPLFRRSVKGLEPTEAALALVDDARLMGQAAEALALKAQGKGETLRGTVRITASVVVSNLILPPIIADLRQAEPLIQIEMVASDAAQNLLRRDADIALRMFDPTQNALIARKLGDTSLGLYAATDYLNHRGRPQVLTDLLTHDVIGFDRADDIIKGYAAHGFAVTRNQFPVRTDDQMVCWHLLLAGAGIGFAQDLLAGERPQLERLDLGMRLPALPVWLVMHEEVRSNARIRRVADFLTTALTARLKS
ncbi:LysR family transcriptional regulator [Asticcacaulis sp. 201]|uniref:LysR family transcriptional regulator n=1 Tax=Asticcacaulis sp. 201 TaxID=3028787 RepID=UPI002916924F|nr:LysR family transcriptional regulator [Asticcacaulis sp. 201]MDV6332654.1 LysR family transcriptional regulator [Asticcacaulis sp. 201]